MLTVHHLGKSQSERIVWLCEELGIPYELKHYPRDRTTMLAPAEFKALHPIGSAPVLTDGDVVLAESAAIVEYVLAKYGNGQLVVPVNDPNFADYLYWFHFANGTLQPAMGRNMVLGRLNPSPEHPVMVGAYGRLTRALTLLDDRLAEHPWLAGPKFTAADIMTVFSLTTMRYFLPTDLGAYPNILAYLQRVAARDGYQRAMAKGDPGMALLLT